MTTTVNLLDQVKIYVGTYAKYNNGSIDGKWLTLSDYSDLEEFYNACKELHADESDPELMFQDFEVPEGLENVIWEGGISDTIFEDVEELEMLSNLTDSEWLEIHSDYDPDSQLFSFDDDFFDTFFAGRPMEAARAASFGDIGWGHEYIYFNGCGNLETTDDIWDVLNKSELITYYKENKNHFSF